MKKTTLTKGLWVAGNLALPLSEGRRILNAGRFAYNRHRERLRTIKQQQDALQADTQTFEAAVRDSGLSRDALTARYTIRKQLWLGLGIIPLLMLMLVTAAALVNGLGYNTLVWRLLSLDFMLLGFAGLCGAKALQSQFHLWQLQTRQLGTFAQWKRTRPWLQDTLRFRASTRVK